MSCYGLRWKVSHICRDFFWVGWGIKNHRGLALRMEVEILFRRYFSAAKKIENAQPDLVAWWIVFFKKDFLQQGNAQEKIRPVESGLVLLFTSLRVVERIEKFVPFLFTKSRSFGTNWRYRQLLFWQFYKILIKQRYGFDSFEVIEDPEVFVWRVNGIAVETKSHEDGFWFQFFFE